MKVIEHIDKAKNPMVSFEIIPPMRGSNIQDVIETVEELAPYNPPWIDVTAHSAGAYYNELDGGQVERRIYKKRPGTIGICGIIQNRFKIDTVTHLLCQGFTQEETEDALIELNYLGIHNVLALRGDGLNYKKSYADGRKVNRYASDLVEQLSDLKQGKYVDEISGARPLDFCVGVAGYPEKHFEAPNMALDIEKLKYKVDCGADYIVTQMFFDNQKYFDFVKECRDAGINVPIIPGLKILKSYKQLTTIPRKFFIDFPDDLVGEVASNPDHAQEIGTKWAIKQSKELLEFGVPCLHFYVMRDTNQVQDVVKSVL